MIYPQPTGLSSQPEHLQMAINMANELLSMFSLNEQNEAIAMICQRVREVRINEKHELEVRVETIEKSLQGVPLFEAKNAQTKQ